MPQITPQLGTVRGEPHEVKEVTKIRWLVVHTELLLFG